MGARPSSFVAPVVPVVAPRVWSAQHNDIFTWFGAGRDIVAQSLLFQGDTPRNLIVRARAGATKTSSIIEGVNRAPEHNILVCAFSKLIADELKDRITNPAVDVMTLHSLGLRLLRREWRGMPVCEKFGERADSLTDTVLQPWEREHGEKVPRVIRHMVSALHSKGREMVPLDTTYDDLVSLACRFDLVPDENWGIFDLDFVVTHAWAAMTEAATNQPTYDIGVDYPDMIFLPLAWKLTARDYELGVIDEAQDMTLAQLEIFERSVNGRLCIVGDDRQAIFGFRGADSKSLDRLKAKLGAAELPLTASYRCGHAIIAEAQKLVPDIVARDTNPAGVVDACDEDQLPALVKPGDFVLSRTNAPLVSLVLKLARHDVRARMVGRDIGKDITKILTKLRCDAGTDIDTTIARIQAWESKQSNRLANCGQAHLAWRIHDQADMLTALAEDVESTRELLAKIDTLFADRSDIDDGAVICSSIHKAKGLEADHVYVLMGTLYKRGHSIEEVNCHYVAITRAKSYLTLVQ